MEDPAPAIPLEKLVAHREWVRRVARALVRDEALAADLEQDAWVEALERPPRTGRSLGGWLAAAMRHNLIDHRRAEGRRRDREEAVARPEAEKSAADVVAEAELLGKVVAAVLELDEPGRGTLLLRYFEDLPLKEVARRQGVPLETVRTRVRTGIEELRRRFDAEKGGHREAWSLALLPLVRGPEVTAPAGMGAGTAVVTGVMVMAKKAIAAAVVLLLLGAGAAWKWGGGGSGRSVRPAELASFKESPPVAPKSIPIAKSTASTPVPVEATTPAPVPVEAPPAPRGTRTVTWPILAGEVPVPSDGTVITLRPIPGANVNEKSPPPGRMVGTDLVVEGLPEKFWNAIAVAPDGTVAGLFVPDGTDRGNAATFRKARRIEVLLKEENGDPAAGERIEARDDGNNPMVPPGTSDKEGRVVLDGILGGRANLLLLPSTEERGPLVLGNWYSSIPVGTVDLEAGDARLEVVLRPQVALLARVTEDGKPSLPPGVVFGIQDATLRQRTDDPSTGTVRFLLRTGLKDPSIQVSATVPGKSGAKAVATWSEAEKALVADLPLQRKPAGTLVVRIKPPADGRFSWYLRRLDGPRGPEAIQGSIFMSFQSDVPQGPPDCRTFGGLKPGRYQYVTDCGLATEPVEFGEEPMTREVSIDLSRVQMVSGRFEGPPGADLAGARALVEGEGLVEAATGTMGSIGEIRTTADGAIQVREPGGAPTTEMAFRVRVPGDRPVRLRASHPSLVPAASGGSVEVEKAAEGVVLRLVEGAHAIFSLIPPGPRDNEPFNGSVTIQLYKGEPEGEPVSTHYDRGTGPFRIGGYAPGTWTLFIDAPGRAPGVLRNVELSDGETDLGTIRVAEGASVRLDIKVAAGAVPPHFYILAYPLGGPRHTRGFNYFGKGEPVVRGLGKGPYRVTVYPSGSPGTTLLEKRVESDGVSETVLELDLR